MTVLEVKVIGDTVHTIALKPKEFRHYIATSKTAFCTDSNRNFNLKERKNGK